MLLILVQLLLLLLLGFIAAEPQKTHSQVLNERILELSKSAMSPDSVTELSFLSEALNIADVTALEHLKNNCIPSGLFEPGTDQNLCVTYPALVVRQIQSRFSSLFSKFLLSGGSFQLPDIWLRHSQSVLTRMLEDLDPQNAPYYRTMLLLIKPPEVRTVVEEHGAAPAGHIDNAAAAAVVKEVPEAAVPAPNCHAKLHNHHVSLSALPTAPEPAPATIPPPPPPPPPPFNPQIGQQFQHPALQAAPEQLQDHQIPQQHHTHLPPHYASDTHQSVYHRFPNHPDLGHVLHQIVPAIPDELLRSQVTSKNPSEIEILL